MDKERTAATRRQNRTREHLRSAFIKLVKEKGYHTITVKDIVEGAAYNRSTFYVHYQDKIELAEDLLNTMLQGLEAAVGEPYSPGQKVFTDKLGAPSFRILSYIYENRDFFELIKYEDTLPGLHTGLPQTLLKIYHEQFRFETINRLPVNMDYFKRYAAYGFYGLVRHWIETGFRASQEEFIQEIIDLTKTHMQAVEYVGRGSDDPQHPPRT